MTNQSLPTRSQLNGALEFFASFAGAAYKDGGGLVEINPIHAVPERAVQEYIERWLRANWEYIVDEMVDVGFVLDDPQVLEVRPCPRPTAHRDHPWAQLGEQAVNLSKVPLPNGWDEAEQFQCEGVRAHPATMIGGSRRD